MKKTILTLTAVAFLFVVGSVCFAQMADTAGQKAMTNSEHMRVDLSTLMSDLSGMTAKMSGMLMTTDPVQMKKLSGMIKDMSDEMAIMSDMMSKGMITDRELEKMQVRLMKTQRLMSEMETKK